MTTTYRLLAVDDEPDIQRTNKKYLESRGYRVDTAACASEALELLHDNSYDCILLDVLLPDLSGFELCAAVRALTSAPILFLSCMDDEGNKVEGLMAGGDDYITKPYSLKELAARVYAQLRRNAMKGFSIDHSQQILTVNGRAILLAQKEFDLFLYLLGNPRTGGDRRGIVSGGLAQREAGRGQHGGSAYHPAAAQAGRRSGEH